ncbi:MAG TPA: hypothetical protein VGE74_14220 [Gemmata sp.]
MTVPNWALRALAALAALAPASRAEAQPGGPRKPPAIIVFPQVTGAPPALPASLFNRPAFDPGPFYNPALNNPYLNQVNVAVYNPFAPNPFNNPFAVNPFAPNPFAVNPFVPNPFNNPFNNPFVGPVGPVVTATPPVAFRQPGQLYYRGPNLQVNPASGLVYKPLSGVARTPDGSTFYYVPGTGLQTASGTYASGTGLYFDPNHNTFLNPASGVISRPGVTNVFIPWCP